jgi:serine/threonine protein kinase
VVSGEVRERNREPTPISPRGLGREIETWLLGTVEASPGRPLGSGYQASVHLYPTQVGDVVVKRPHTSRWLGFLWERLLRREDGVYARLQSVPGVPRSYGLLGGRYLTLEYIPGPSLREHETAVVDRERFFDQLLETIRAMHRAGVAHGDLKRKQNIIVGPGERPYLVDFGVARLRSDSNRGWNRWIFELAKQMDYNAWIKLKYGRRVDDLTPMDATLYRPLLIERIARIVRILWQKLTLRRPRQRWRKRRDQRE